MQGGGEGAQPRSRSAPIAARLEEVLGEPLSGELRRLSSGASRETFAFELPSRGALVAQLARGGAKLNQAPPAVPLLEAAARAGVPVPRVLADGEHDPVLGASWVVVEALPGTTDPGAILAGEGVPPAPQLLDQIAAALAAVHRIPSHRGLAPAIDDPLGLLREWHERLAEPHPTFELAFRVLEAERPPAPIRPALVHGDFRIGNLIVCEQGLSGVLDWELAHVGDPVEDLGWLCVPAWRFARQDRPAAGLGTREQLLAAYERHGGAAVEERALRWWELAGTLRWGVICVMQAHTHLSGAVRSIEHAVIGRRACEVEWDLLELLAPALGIAASEDRAIVDPAINDTVSAAAPGAKPAQADERAPTLHDRPTALELLDAARATLGEDVLPRLEGRAAFQARVTMRALGVVRRELEHAEEHRALRRATLAALGSADETQLARAIRAGEFDGREAHLLGALRPLVQAKLEVANPRYVESTRPTQAEGAQPERGEGR